MRNGMYVASLTDFVNFAYDAQHRIIPDIGIYYDIWWHGANEGDLSLFPAETIFSEWW
jgi:hypothetical protein